MCVPSARACSDQLDRVGCPSMKLTLGRISATRSVRPKSIERARPDSNTKSEAAAPAAYRTMTMETNQRARRNLILLTIFTLQLVSDAIDSCNDRWFAGSVQLLPQSRDMTSNGIIVSRSI